MHTYETPAAWKAIQPTQHDYQLAIESLELYIRDLSNSTTGHQFPALLAASRIELQQLRERLATFWHPLYSCPIGLPVEMCRIEGGRIKDIQTGYVKDTQHARTLTHSCPTHWRMPQL